ncbi:4-hydroxy-3-methylbut-2-enyl diphosphate reductase [Chloroflexota bacterium]
MRIEKSKAVGFCSGVKRAIEILENTARERGEIETLGAVVHNQQVLEKLAGIGITVAESIDDIKGNIVATGAHGVSPQVEEELKSRFNDVITTACPFVHRAQIAAQKLVADGFFTIIYGDENHPEVKSILGWAEGKGLATLDKDIVKNLAPLPKKLGILSQTTQIPSRFNDFVKDVIDTAFIKDSEIRIIDTICHDIPERQQAALELASRVDLMFVIGSPTSANTNHLADLCSTVTKTHFVETADDIDPEWIENRQHIGVTAGASTSEDTINDVVNRLEDLAKDGSPG